MNQASYTPTHTHTPVAVDRSLEELHRVLCMSQSAAGQVDLGTHTAHACITLKCVCPAFRLLIHHLQYVPPTLLRCGQLLTNRHKQKTLKRNNPVTIHFSEPDALFWPDYSWILSRIFFGWFNLVKKTLILLIYNFQHQLW